MSRIERRAIPGHPDYFAGRDGSIWSTKSGELRPMRTFVRGRAGHLGVNLTQAGVYRLHSVHRLIALAWIGAPLPGQIVMHADDDPTNNRADNLSYGTPAENSLQMVERRRQARGERHGLHRLNESDVCELRRRFASGERPAPLAREFGISITTVCDVVSGRTWKQVA